MRVDTQAMMRVRATTKARLRAFAAARRWKLTEAAEAAVDALEAAEKKDSRRKRETATA